MISFPSLREDLTISEGPRTHDARPSWTLHDPARNRFFRLDWLTFEVFQRWSIGQPALIAQCIADQTVLAPTEEDVQAVFKFAQSNSLLQFSGGAKASDLADAQKRARSSWWLQLLHNYLFFRVPLIRPNRFLQVMASACGFLFQSFFWRLTAVVAAVGLTLVYRQWDVFAASWMNLGNIHSLILIAVSFVGVKILHELGHGLAAARFGVRVPTMGVAFLVMMPMAYTDTNEAWKLAARRPRLLVNAGGMLAEICIAAWATLAWGLLPDGTLRSVAFVLAVVTWIKSVLVNLSPIMRFDGYYLLSDLLDIPNLHTRCFALARWQLRQWLFGLQEDPPEFFRATLRRGLVALAIFIWLYRLVVFVGIAIYVYHFFFKALGVVLFAVEIWYFILKPIVAELKVWRSKWPQLRGSPRARLSGCALAALAVFSFLPLPQRLVLPAQLSPVQEFKLVAAEAGRLVQIDLADGAPVVSGQVLLELAAPDLVHRQRALKAKADSLQAEIVSLSMEKEGNARAALLRVELASTRAAQDGIAWEVAQLKPRSPFGGTFRLSAAAVHRPGEWVQKAEPFGTVIGDAGWQVVAYLGEQDAHRISTGAAAMFYPEGSAGRAIALRTVSIEQNTTRELVHPMLERSAGGPIPTRMHEGHSETLDAFYRVTFIIDAGAAAPTEQLLRGIVSVSAGSEPLLAGFGRTALSVFWRELGF